MSIRRFAVLSFAFVATALSAQQNPGKITTTFYPAKLISGAKPTPPPTHGPGVVPLFLEGDGFSSSFVIVNTAVKNVSATIALRDLEGRPLLTKEIVLEGGSRSSVSISSLLEGLPDAPSMGSLSIQQDVNVPGKMVLAQLTIVDRRNSTPAYIDEEVAMAATDGSSTLRGVADSAERSALVAITNLADSIQQVTLQCLAEKGDSSSLSLAIPAYATSLSPACSERKVDSFTDYKDQLDHGTFPGATGYEIIGDGAPGTLAAFALAPHKHHDGEVFSAVAFVDPKSLKSANTVYTGVPFGTQTVLSDGIYSPRIALTNFSKLPARVTMETSSSRSYGSESGTETSETITPKVLHVHLAAGESKEVQLAIDSDSGGLQHSVIVKSDRLPGEVQSKLVSRSDGRLFEVELLGKDEKATENGGGHPWVTRDGTESHLLLFNHTAGAKSFGVNISNGLQTWSKAYRVAPLATRQLSINQIIRDQAKDDDGKTLDPHYHEGVVIWSTANAGDGKGRLLVSDRAAAMARNFSCPQTIVLCGMNINVFGDGFIVMDNPTDYALGIPQFCGSSGSCFGGVPIVAVRPASFVWTLGNISIVTFSTPGDQRSGRPNLTGIAPGSTSAFAEATSGLCQAGGVGNPPPKVTMCPTTVTLSNTTQEPLRSLFPKVKTGIGIVASMLVGGTSAPYTDAQIVEAITQVSNNCGANSPAFCTATGGGTFTVGASGVAANGTTFPAATNIFYDQHFYTNTISALPAGDSCTAVCKQTYSCNGKPIGTNSFTITTALVAGTLQSTAVTNVNVTKK